MEKMYFYLIVFVCSIYCNAQSSNFKFCEDFQSESFSRGYRNKEITKNNGYYISGDSKEGRFNDGYLTTFTKKTGVYGKPKRSEYGFRLYDSIGYTKFFSFSFKIDKKLQFDKRNLGREIMISQWHSKPAPNKDWKHYREQNPFNRPSIALYVTTNDNKNFYLVLRYGNNGKKEFGYKGEIWSVVALKQINKDKWHDMVFKIKWSFTNSGFVAAWVNNEAFTPFNGYNNNIYGANMHNESPAYFKFGQYRYWDDSNTHKIHFDELRVGNTFREVSIYDDLPEMFFGMKNLQFVKNHK